MQMQRRCALLPLGAARGPEALNVWEHVAFANWLDERELSADARRQEMQSDQSLDDDSSEASADECCSSIDDFELSDWEEYEYLE